MAQVCFSLYEYKDCKSVLKKDGWDVSQFHKMVKENSEQFDFGGGVMIRRDSRGSRRKKRGKKQSSKKSKKKDKDRYNDEGEGGVRVEEQPMRPQVRVHNNYVNVTFFSRRGGERRGEMMLGWRVEMKWAFMNM